MNNRKFLSICLFFVMTLLSTKNMFGYDAKYIEALYNETLKSYTAVKPANTKANTTNAANIMELIPKLFSGFNFEFAHLDTTFQLNSYFTHFPCTTYPSAQEHIDFNTVIELELIRGKARSEDNFTSYVTSFINTSYVTSFINGENKKSFLFTNLGKKFFSEALAMPITNIAELNQRQAIIKILSENEKLSHDIQKHLEIIQKHEEYFVDFFDTKELPSDVYQAIYPLIPKSEHIPLVATGSSHLNRFMSQGIMPLATIGLIGLSTQDSNVIPGAASTGFMTLICLAEQKQYDCARKQVQTHLIKVAQMMRSMHALTTIVAQHPELHVLMPDAIVEYKKLEENKVYKLLKQSTFDDGEASVFSSIRKIIFAHQYLCDPEVRKEFQNVLHFTGKLDSYAALAQKINIHTGSINAPFCFADFVENSKKPVLEINEFWNPFVPAAQAVPNSISLNTGKERCILITGPNTGGKSTNMKAVALNIILAQSFGIAAAKSITLTPFEHVTTYLNIGDDTASGKSLFKAEAERAQKLLNSLKNLAPHQFGFAMIDEIFTGTSPDRAESLAYDLMKKLSTLQNVIFVNATHFKPLTRLEQETKGIVKNYQVEVKTDSKDQVTAYTYKLVPGISRISSAMQVAEDSGLSFD